MSTFKETLANTYLKQFGAMSVEMAKMIKVSPQFSEFMRGSATNALLAQKVQDAARQMSSSPVLKAQAQEAIAQIASNVVLKQHAQDAVTKIAGNAAVQAAALDVVKFPKTPAFAGYAQTLLFAQSMQLEGLQDVFQKVAKQAALSAYQPKTLAFAAEALKSVDVGFGARIMEKTLREPQVKALAEMLVATARDQGFADGSLDETDDGDVVSSVQRTAVYLFVYLCGTALYLMSWKDPRMEEHIAFMLAVLAACYAAAKKINGED